MNRFSKRPVLVEMTTWRWILTYFENGYFLGLVILILWMIAFNAFYNFNFYKLIDDESQISFFGMIGGVSCLVSIIQNFFFIKLISDYKKGAKKYVENMADNIFRNKHK